MNARNDSDAGVCVVDRKRHPADCTNIVGVEPGPAAPALAFMPPAPNPVRTTARMPFVLPMAEKRVELGIYDVQGRLRRLERFGPMQAGSHSWTWDGRDGRGEPMASGVYFARLMVGTTALRQRILKLAP